MLPTNEQLADIFATSTLMAMRERINVPRELLADLLGNDHDKRIMAERHLLAMLANAPAAPAAPAADAGLVEAAGETGTPRQWRQVRKQCRQPDRASRPCRQQC